MLAAPTANNVPKAVSIIPNALLIFITHLHEFLPLPSDSDIPNLFAYPVLWEIDTASATINACRFRYRFKYPDLFRLSYHCRTYFDDGSITDANRYSIREWNHNAKDMKYNYNNTTIFNDFVQVVNSQSRYNNNTGGIINAIPLIAYHNIDNNMTRSSTNIGLFASEMKYLHDNGFKVITMKDLGYDEMSNRLYVKNML